ncbi:hypothetical protein EJP67_33285 [Variovorax guangxiensis]|uniref:Uncharacterized protein n=1 Tax=Variovorax guangxiensis TaxID=1775474 RepID=A0A433MVT7_9BURK|nr:hypothetical protein [Variovorax guangxiensis]RUR71932.1 hypothetical protein EJP67_33285 [Variovorax guangxiensis]
MKNEKDAAPTPNAKKRSPDRTKEALLFMWLALVIFAGTCELWSRHVVARINAEAEAEMQKLKPQKLKPKTLAQADQAGAVQ